MRADASDAIGKAIVGSGKPLSRGYRSLKVGESLSARSIIGYNGKPQQAYSPIMIKFHHGFITVSSSESTTIWLNRGKQSHQHIGWS
ncbi:MULTISPECIES: hypothetical protein [Bacillota]|uniref:hypothetical protein n=1 Tax=Bacillota TaxID=1239 RepID=UPI0039EE1297